MIRNFGDHAANERTYLAWVRTGVAVMAFGFLVEKFDIFLTYIARALHHTGRHPELPIAQALGMGLVVLGILMMVVATFRFVWIGRVLDAPDMRDRLNPLPYVLMVAALALIGVSLLVYLTHVGVRP